MPWIELVTLLSGIQLIVFGFCVGRARGRCGLAVPAMAGHPEVERYIRGHLNSVEWIVIFLPTLWIAAKYWNATAITVLGFIYLIGRTLYFAGYIKSPEKRSFGFLVSALATVVLLLLALGGLVKSALA